MKFHDEYVLYGVIIVVVLFALAYSWGNIGDREHLESHKYQGSETHMNSDSKKNEKIAGTTSPTCPTGTTFDPPTGKCKGAQTTVMTPDVSSPIYTTAPIDPGDSYILKSSLVPCTCTMHSMGCEKHAGGKEFSVAPGDKDSSLVGNSDQETAQNQSGLMRPFSSAFSNQGEPTGFLNSFSAFG